MNETKNPWTVVSRAIAYENPWIRVDHHDVLNPAGKPGVYGVVHFKNHAIGIVPIDENGNVILVGQYRFPHAAYSWEIPEGGGPAGPTILESAQRELREECGVTARNWLEVVGMDLSNSVTNEMVRRSSPGTSAMELPSPKRTSNSTWCECRSAKRSNA